MSRLPALLVALALTAIGSLALLPTAHAQIMAPCPAGLGATSSLDGSIVVEWDQIGEASTLQVHRRVGDGPWEAHAQLEGDATVFIDEQTDDGVTYTYTVMADHETLTDPEFCQRTSAIAGAEPSVPPCPTFRAAALANGDGNLSWEEVPGAVEYRVYKSIEDGPLALYFTTPRTGLGDGNREPGTTYHYTVTAVLADGSESEGCTEIPLERLPDRETACTAPMAEALPDGSVRLTWDLRDDAELSHVGVGRGGPGPAEQHSFQLDADAEAFVDNTTEPGSTYRYDVWAHLASGHVDYCGRAHVTAIPFFPSLALAGLVTAGAVGAFAVLRRRG